MALLAFAVGVVASSGQFAQTNLFTVFNSTTIPDGSTNGLQDVRNVVSDIAQITSVRVRLKVNGNFNGDLYGYVRHSGGTTTNISVLLNRPGRTTSDFDGYADPGLDVTFDDSAAHDIHTYREVTIPSAGDPLYGTWQPDARSENPVIVTTASPRTAFLSTFTGLSADGEWTLFLADVSAPAGNYLNSWGLEITGKARPAITWTNPATINYGTALGTGQLNATAEVPGTFTYNPPAGTVLAVGSNQALSVTFVPADTNSYVEATASLTLTVTPAALTVAADSLSRPYGATNPVFTVTYSGFVNGEDTNVLSGPPVLTTPAQTNSPAGVYPINITRGSLASTNYTFAYTNGTLTVEPAVLLMRANDASRGYGQTNPPFTATISGLVNGEDTNALSGTLLFLTAADTNSPVGTYAIEPGGLTATNYALTFSNGMLTVTAAALTVAADNPSRAYGVTNPPLTGALTGVQKGDNITATFHTAADTNSPVGAYPITPTLRDPEGKLGNYSVLTNTGTLTVEPAALLVWADDASRAYGQPNPVFTATFIGLVNGEDTNALGGTLFFNTAADINSPVGTYAIEPGGLEATNYAITYSNGTLTVVKAASVLTVGSSANPALPGSPVTFTANLTALAPSSGTPSGAVQFKVDGADYGDAVTLTNGHASLSAAILPAGEHSINVEYADDGNFLGATAVLDPPQIINTPPVAAADVLPRVPNQVTRVPVSVLLANDSDADGDAVVFDSVNATSTAGGTLSQADGWVFYTPPAGFTNDDSFNYVVRDGHGGFAPGAVAVTILANRGTAARLTLLDLGSRTFRIVSAGIPWGDYTIEFTESLLNQNWGIVAVGAADLWGNFVVDDSAPTGTRARFYRAIYEGDGIGSLPFRLSLASSANPALPGSNVTFTVNLTTFAQGNVTPSGTVQFKVDGADYGDPVTLASGSASLSTATLPLGEHSVSAEYSGDTNYRSAVCVLALPQVINTPPVAVGDVIHRDPIHGTKALVSDLLANDSEVDGDPLVFEGINSTSAEGGTLSMAEGWIFYAPPAGFVSADSFTYRLRDNRGGTATATVEIVPRVGNEPSANWSLLDLGGGNYRIVFSGVPWRIYTIQYTESLEQPNWQSITTDTADSHGLFEYEDVLPPGTQSRFYRSVFQSAGATASPFRLAVWTNFIGHTNGRTMVMWSERTHPEGWPSNAPVLAWNTNGLLYGLEGFTGISQCNEFEVSPGQLPVTLLTRRHGYARGHGMGTNGLRTLLAGKRVWFCAADNTVVQMTVAAELIRVESVAGGSYDHGLVVFTEDVPEGISPVYAISPADMETYYWNTPDLPYLFLGTEQSGLCLAGVPPFVIPGDPFFLMKGGDSGSPNMIPSPDNKLIMFSGRGTSGPNPQMQADIDALSVYKGLNTNNYQLRWYDLSPWGP